MRTRGTSARTSPALVQVSELNRDIHGLIAAKTNFNIGDIVNYGGETFLSEEVAISLLQEAKEAFRRCRVLSKTSDLACLACILCVLVDTRVFQKIKSSIQN